MKHPNSFLKTVLLASLLVPKVQAFEAWGGLLAEARSALEDGQLDESEKILERAVGAIRSPSSIHMQVFEELQVLGVVLAEAGEPTRGARLIRRGLELAEIAVGRESPDLEPFWSMLGVLELRHGNAEAAASLLERSYRKMMGTVSGENAEFQEVLRAYAESLRRTHRETDLLVLESHYGHEVDLTSFPVDPAPSREEQEQRYRRRIRNSRRRATRSQRRGGREKKPSREISRNRRTQRSESQQARLSGVNRESPHQPPHFSLQKEKGLQPTAAVAAKPPMSPQEQRSRLLALRGLLSKVPVAEQSMNEQGRWISQQLRKVKRSRSLSRSVIQKTYREAVSRGQKMAFLAKLAPQYRSLEAGSDTELLKLAFEKARPRYEAFERSLNRAAGGLKRLMETLQAKGS